jgi:hypothetical protein
VWEGRWGTKEEDGARIVDTVPSPQQRTRYSVFIPEAARLNVAERVGVGMLWRTDTAVKSKTKAKPDQELALVRISRNLDDLKQLLEI